MYIKAKVTPGAKKESVVREDETTWKIAVREPAKRNLANARVRELLAQEFHLPSGKVGLISGHHSPSKIFSVESEML